MSGFLLMLKDAQGDETSLFKACWASMKKRISRLYLLHALTTLFCFFLYVYIFWRVKGIKGMVELFSALLLHLSLMQSWFPKFAVFFNGPSWYLSSVAFLYFVFPLIRKITLKATRLKRLMIVVSLFAFRILLASAAIKISSYDFEFFKPWGVKLWSWYFFPLARLVDFWLGCIAGTFYKEYRDRARISNFLAALLQIALAALGFCFCSVNSENYSFTLRCFFESNIMRVLFAVLWCYFFMEENGLLRPLIVKPLVALGNISGYCYLIHGSVMLFKDAMPSFLKPNFSMLGAASRYVVALIELLATIILSLLWVELNKRIAKRGTPAVDKASGESQETPRS